ncbi:MAG: TetR/AcrR family transcriptional regulator [Notoacmeibacter sp.]|nr:TetR/AcrR family transcriptional regulator [Notoacmeibacter sp.]MCC0032212.1 TetR/AcrR family transcriptional regulator [Brucellaceae bacterium]
MTNDTVRDDNPRRREIALAARALIAEHGFEGLRTRDIAARVGINIATLHYHVPGKAALVELLASSLRDEFIAVKDRHPEVTRTPRERLRQELDDYIHIRRDKPQVHQAMGELMIRAKRDPSVEAIMRPLTAHWHACLAGIFTEGAADGSFRSGCDPQAAASIVIGALTWRGRSVAAPEVAIEAIADELMNAFAVLT